MLQVTTGIFGVASTIHTVIIHLNTRFENTAFSVIFLYSEHFHRSESQLAMRVVVEVQLKSRAGFPEDCMN